MTDVTPEPGVEVGADSTRARILAEATEMFTRHGYHRTTLRLLADRLGVTKAAILYHFPAKDRIITALMEPFVAAVEAAIERAATQPLPQRRWALIEGILDTYLQHKGVLLMARTDATIFTQETMYQRFMRMPMRVVEILVGSDAPLDDKVWAVQLMGTLGDSVLMFGEAAPAQLRAAILRGTVRLLTDGPPSRRPPEARVDWIAATPTSPLARVHSAVKPHRDEPTGDAPVGGRRIGRPRVLTGERVTRAREMHASGAHNVDDIAAELGVSRATVYRYLA